MKNIKDIFGVDEDYLVDVLVHNPGATGYLQGAISEQILKETLKAEGYEVYRIKEKPAGGFDNKIDNYKGDFLIRKPGSKDCFVVESKGVKTNSEFRGANKKTEINRKNIISFICCSLKNDPMKVYNKGLARYNKAKQAWETKNPGKQFPEFQWNMEFPGSSSVNLNGFFASEEDVKEYFNGICDELFSESAFRRRDAAYLKLETHKPSIRTDSVTKIKQAAPLKSDFSILAVDLFQRLGRHKIVFADSNQLPHSPTSPNHLYQNYLIDIIIPGKKDMLCIRKPWYESIGELLDNSQPRVVPFDETQLDDRGHDGDEE